MHFSLKSKPVKFGLFFASVHLIALIWFAIYMRATEPVAQLDMLWIYWDLLDNPVSTVFHVLVNLGIEDWPFAYFPHYFTFGLLGTIWYFFIGYLVGRFVQEIREPKTGKINFQGVYKNIFGLAFLVSMATNFIASPLPWIFGFQEGPALYFTTALNWPMVVLNWVDTNFFGGQIFVSLGPFYSVLLLLFQYLGYLGLLFLIRWIKDRISKAKGKQPRFL